MAAARDARRFIPAAERNAEPIARALTRLLTRPGVLLELASGTGQHAARIAPRLPHLVWQPSEADPGLFDSIAAWTAGVGNVRPPRPIDVTAPDWAVDDLAAELVAVYASNLLHIAPWTVARGLLAGAGRILPPGGLLLLYGPYFRRGHPAGDGNRRFDAELRDANTEWGIRTLEAVAAEAAENGLSFREAVEMPANNLILVFAGATGGRDD